MVKETVDYELSELKLELSKHSTTLDGQTFGPSLKSELVLDPKYVHFNNGSLGIIPKQVKEARFEIIDKVESLPDLSLDENFLNKTNDTKVNKVLARVAKFVNSDLDNIVFINNATQGMNIALKSLGLKEGDILLYVSTAYLAIDYLIKSLVDTLKIKIEVIEHSSQLNVLDQVKERVNQLESQNKKVKVTVIDAISSLPAFLLPYQEITQFMQSKDSYVVIDGAHAYNQIPLDLNSLKPDYFVTTLHKWGYSFRPTAILYIHDKHLQSVRPVVTGYGYGTNSIRQQFNWPGTMDFSAWLATASSLDFIERLGELNIRNYLQNLSLLGGTLIANILQTEVLGNTKLKTNMVNIPLFHSNHKFAKSSALPNFKFTLEGLLLKKHNFVVRIFEFQDRWCTRISAQIHLDLEDYKKLGLAFKEAVDELNK